MKYSKEQLLEMYKVMMTSRIYDEKIGEESMKGKLAGMFHLSRNQEAVGAGVVTALKDRDVLKPYHRDHGGMFQRLSMKKFTSGVLCKQDGYCNGTGGDFHQCDFDANVFPIHGEVGANYSILAGYAWAMKQNETDGVLVSVMGDGSTSQGMMYESWNFASIYELPIVYVIVNNSYAMSTPIERYTKAKHLSDRASGFNMESQVVFGQDPVAIREAMDKALEKARKFEPQVVEIMTYRECGHYFGDPKDYVDKDREEKYLEEYPDPVTYFKNMLFEEGIATNELDEIDDKIVEEVNEAFEHAYAQPMITNETLKDKKYVYANMERGL
jgi:pyruvate dehydrogenase E1 component alpha subunit